MPDNKSKTKLSPAARATAALVNRRSALAAGAASFAALAQPNRLLASDNTNARPTGKSVILLWMAGGPSQIDTWDPKPDRAMENRGPFASIASSVSGIRVCEHLPKQAAMMDRFTLIRSVDCRHGEHSPNKVFQTGNRDASPRQSARGDTLVNDLESRGLLDDVLIVAMGDFGRTPVIGTQGGFTGGRNHWKGVMSACLAGGGIRHGQVIGASDKAGGAIDSRPVQPSDLAATIYKHMGVPLDASYLDNNGRPLHIVDGPGEPLGELL